MACAMTAANLSPPSAWKRAPQQRCVSPVSPSANFAPAEAGLCTRPADSRAGVLSPALLFFLMLPRLAQSRAAARRQPKPEGAALAGGTLQANLTIHALDQQPADIQAQPGA